MRAVLSPAAYRSAWEHLDLGAMPIVLYVEEPASRTELAEHMQGSELDPWLVAAFKTVATPSTSVDLRLYGGTTTRALATGGVLAVLTRDALTITEIDDPVQELINLLPTDRQDVRAQFGAAVVDASGRRRRAEPVDWVSGEGVAQLKGRIGAMLDTISE